MLRDKSPFKHFKVKMVFFKIIKILEVHIFIITTLELLMYFQKHIRNQRKNYFS